MHRSCSFARTRCEFLLVFSFPACAQLTTGSISGYVLDPSRRPIPHAEVKVSDAARGLTRKAASDSLGFYLVAELPPAGYTVSASAENFQPVITRSVRLNVNSRQRLDFLPSTCGSSSPPGLRS